PPGAPPCPRTRVRGLRATSDAASSRRSEHPSSPHRLPSGPPPSPVDCSPRLFAAPAATWPAFDAASRAAPAAMPTGPPAAPAAAAPPPAAAPVPVPVPAPAPAPAPAPVRAPAAPAPAPLPALAPLCCGFGGALGVGAVLPPPPPPDGPWLPLWPLLPG